jgi:hypothetical protein
VSPLALSSVQLSDTAAACNPQELQAGVAGSPSPNSWQASKMAVMLNPLPVLVPVVSYCCPPQLHPHREGCLPCRHHPEERQVLLHRPGL